MWRYTSDIGYTGDTNNSVTKSFIDRMRNLYVQQLGKEDESAGNC